LANCVSKEADKTSISISYIEEDDSSDEINNEAAVPKKADYDSLDF